MILARKIGIGTASHGKDQASYFHVPVHGPGCPDADNGVHIIFLVQLVGIDAHGRDSHPAALDRNPFSFIITCITVHSPYPVITHHI